MLSYMKCRLTIPKFYLKSKKGFVDYFVGNWPIPYDEAKWYDVRKLWLERFAQNSFSWNMIAAAHAVYYEIMLTVYKKFKNQFDLSILYEDFDSNPEEWMEKVLKVMKLASGLKTKALAAVGQDSQKEIYGKRGFETVSVTDELISCVDSALKECDSEFTFDTDIDTIRNIQAKV